MSDLKRKAQEVAEAGRFGDSQLIHVSPEELRGLASLMPDGKLTTNPKTGLPEAFFFLPFLAGLGAAAAPAAAATTAAAAAAPAMAGGLGALGAGMAAGAAAPALAATAPAAAGALGATGAGLAASSAAPALAATGAAGGLGSLAAAPAAAAALPTQLAGLQLTTPAIASAAPTATGAISPAVTAAAGNPAVHGLLGSTPAATAGAGSKAAATGALSNMGQAGKALAGPASFANPAGSTAAGLAGTFPAAPAAAATGATKAGGLGGLLGGMDMSQMLQYGALASMMMPQGGGGGGGDDDEEDEPNANAKSYERGPQAENPNPGDRTGGEFNYFPKARYYKHGGLVKGYAEGGLASLAPKSPEASDEELIDMTVAALQGQAPNPDAIIQQFIQVFGPEALRDLIQQVQGGGDGMSDSVPAMVEGQEPAALSEGEFVVPADVVSGLGNGSTEAGARQLEGMMDRTRASRGMPQQPPAINPSQIMPR